MFLHLFACIFVPDFPVAALVRAEPELRAHPVAVLDGKPPFCVVIAANEKARQLGIEPGMTKLQAETCPAVSLQMRSADAEESAYHALLDCAHSFSPRVEPVHGSANAAPFCDAVVLDISGMEKFLGAPKEIARRVLGQASHLGLAAHLGIAGNCDAAIHAARGFSGITIIRPGDEAKRLGELPLEVLQPSTEIQETLDRWGIHSFRDLAALPELALTQRLGQTGLHLQRLARGAVSRHLVPVEPPLKFEEAMELESPVHLLEPLSFILGHLLHQLCARLAARSLAVRELHLKMQLDSAISEEGAEQASVKPLFERDLKFAVPMRDSQSILKILQLDLQSHPPGAPVLKVMLAAQPAELRISQNGLFQAASPEPERLCLTLARIAAIVGEERLGSAELLDSYRPDAFEMRQFAPTPETPPKSSSKTVNEAAIAFRRFRLPMPANVAIKDGLPAAVVFGGVRAKVMYTAGPWRGSGDWWSDTEWARDEWDVALSYAVTSASPLEEKKNELALYRIYQERKSGRWFVEGSYD